MTFIKHTAPDGAGCAGACCLRVEDLGVTLGGAQVLRRVSLHLHCGEMVALIGPNGAGKTTLLRTILGQLPHTGSIRFERVGGRPERPLIGYVPQSPAFDRGDPMSVLDLFAASTSRRPVFLPAPKALRETVRASLARTHAEQLIDQRVGALSGGELQRVLLAMALDPLPHILILDEPLSGVDAEGVGLLLTMLDEIRVRYDLSILVSTHDFSMLELYADKVILLRGEVLRTGAPKEVLDSPEFRSVFHLTPFGQRGGG